MRPRQKRTWIDLRALRKNQGWAQWEAADKLGVTREYISILENGRQSVSMRMMDEIIRVFHVKYEDFYRGANIPQSGEA